MESSGKFHSKSLYGIFYPQGQKKRVVILPLGSFITLFGPHVRIQQRWELILSFRMVLQIDVTSNISDQHGKVSDQFFLQGREGAQRV